MPVRLGEEVQAVLRRDDGELSALWLPRPVYERVIRKLSVA
jgi:hypothetical protein